MKKIGVTAFALLYAMLILSASAERSSVWAAREAEAVAHPHSADHSATLRKALPSDTYLSQKKLLETGFVIELPREASFIHIESSRYIPFSFFKHHSNPAGQLFQSRSPPALS